MSLKLPLVLEEIDSDTGCIARDWQLGEVDLDALGKLLDDDFKDIGEHHFVLDQNDVRLVSSSLMGEALEFPQGELRGRHALLDALPYKIHTRRELAMMLRGEKPLARFSMWPGEDFQAIIRQPFAKHVESGLLRAFVEREERSYGIATTYSFTLPGEEWRVAAMTELWNTGLGKFSADEFTRREGQLLGYEDWQTDAFLKLQHEMVDRACAG